MKIMYHILLIIISITTCFSTEYLQLENGKTLGFLNAEESYAYLSDSKFIKNLTPLDVSLRLEKDYTNNSELDYMKDYQSFLGLQMRNWSFIDKRYLKKRFTTISPAIDKLNEQIIPDTVLLIRTTGDQEFNAFYTVENAIIFPGLIRTTSTFFPWWGYFTRYIESILIHEIYHIFSRNHSGIRNNVYTFFGFDKIETLNLHKSIKTSLITNPDDHSTQYKITLKDSSSEKTTNYTLLIMSKYSSWVGYPEFPARISVLIEYLDLKLHPINFIDGSWVSVVDKKDQPIKYDLKEIPDFSGSVGLKLSAPFSPEEIAAESFVILIKSFSNKKEYKKRTPAEIEKMEEFYNILKCEK